MNQNKLRNIAIIAHVDHGKTTLVDAILKQTSTFAAHEKEMQQSTILDSNELEREKGVTILAKNTSVTWKDYQINILDTPGHADFSGEVERVLNMADGCILLIDAAEGVLSQTKFVLKLALELKLKPIVVINKVDRKDQRVKEVKKEVIDLFLDLANSEKQLDFPVLYARGIEGIVGKKIVQNSNHSLQISDSNDLTPLFETIISTVPAPTGDTKKPLQLQINNLDWDDHLGKIIIGRIFAGSLKHGQKVAVIDSDKQTRTATVDYLFIHKGLGRKRVKQAQAGQIVAIAGINNPKIGETIADSQSPLPLLPLSISEPTVKIKIKVNTSPFAGQEADYSTSRQLKHRLDRELETNVGLKVINNKQTDGMTLVGRGELHLAILIETMRRENYEFSLARPQVVLKEINGQTHEPWEAVIIEVPEKYTGDITATMGQRHAQLQNMTQIKNGVRFEYEIATANIISYRQKLLTFTSGEGAIHSNFLEFRPQGETITWTRGGAIVAQKNGQVTAYSLDKAQQRGQMLVNPGEEVYAGQIVGFNNRQHDLVMNIAKGKKLTNMRAATADDTIVLAPAWKPSLEQFITLIGSDEMLEVTPKNLRLRKADIKKALKNY